MPSMLPEFRTIGAADNNLNNPWLNPVRNSPETAIASPNPDPSALTDGTNPRAISDAMGGPSATDNDPVNSAWLYAFGQFVDHDLDLESVTGTPSIDITVPAGDSTFPAGSTIPLTRAATDPNTHTVVNTVAGLLDLSQVYGSDSATAKELRNGDGTMKTTSGDALPVALPNEPTGVFTATPVGSFVSGDARVTENPELTDITTMFVREHNYWVGQLHDQHPDWSGDQLYNMAKALTTAEYQNVVYSEFLPALVGNAVGPYRGYDASVNPQVSQEFSTAAFRVGHSQVSGTQTGLDNQGNQTFSQSLAEAFGNTPAQDTANDGINSLVRGLSSEYSQNTDVYAVDELRNLLAASPDSVDLIAIDIQRERDVGINTLNNTRSALGLDRYTSFDQISSDSATQDLLRSNFGSVDKVDLFVGGLAEDHPEGSAVGPTFQKIIADQFSALRAGDRFFWQNEAFDPQTQQRIGDTTLGDIVQRTTGTPVEQQNVFLAQQRHMSDVAPDGPGAPQLIIGVDADNATINGGEADDTIVAGRGLHQLLSGGGGSNVFVFNGSGHTDTIRDFVPAVDKLRFQPSDPTATVSDTKVSIADFQGSAVVQHDGNAITLSGVSASSLSAQDFIFPPGNSVELDRLSV